jgi:aspartate kinase
MLLSTGEQVSVALMAMAVHHLGFEAVSLTGSQIGIKTDSSHTRARIRSISTDRIRQVLDQGKIVIAAGFQGIDEDYNITTLGRGGSDTTAVALAAVLAADSCEIYTDVDGVYTTDPRILPEARQMKRVSYDEMLELASLGAGVMHSRSIEFGKKFHVPIHVRSSFSDVPGTVIASQPESRDRSVCGAAITQHEAQITIEQVPDRPGASLEIFSRIAAQNIPVDMIVQNVGAQGHADVSFTVIKQDLSATLRAAEQAAEALGAKKVTYDDGVSKVSVVGLGMAAQAGVAKRMFRSLANAGINVLMITTSEIKISVLVSRDQAVDALRAVHREFQLDKEPMAVRDDEADTKQSAADAVDVVSRLQAMEELAIDGIALDAAHARVTIEGVPDQPGVAADVFEAVAEAGIFVDMIVQSIGHQGRANVSFTVPRADLEKSRHVAGALVKRLGSGTVTSSDQVAKLTVSGIGMRSHTGVAMRMFRSLAGTGINVEMVNTSEVQVNVVVDARYGAQGLTVLKQAFAEFLR